MFSELVGIVGPVQLETGSCKTQSLSPAPCALMTSARVTTFHARSAASVRSFSTTDRRHTNQYICDTHICVLPICKPPVLESPVFRQEQYPEQ